MTSTPLNINLECTLVYIAIASTAVLTAVCCGLLSPRHASSAPVPHTHALPVEIGEASPFCSTDGKLHTALAQRGFIVDDLIKFDSGAWIAEYYMAGHDLWIAHWPDGRECLIEGGDLSKTPKPE